MGWENRAVARKEVIASKLGHEVMGKKLTPESRLKKVCIHQMKRHNIFSYPVIQGLGCHPGLPDRVAHHDGHVTYLEFKAATGKLGLRQKEFKLQCKRDGISYHVVRKPEDIDRIFNLPTLFK